MNDGLAKIFLVRVADRGVEDSALSFITNNVEKIASIEAMVWG
jgi:hypothetical protein